MQLNTLLDLDNPAPILGDDLKPLVQKTLSLFQYQRAPMLMYVGPPGSGKTHIAKACAIQYAKWRRENGFPQTKARYIVFDPQTTKSSIIGGKEIQNGSLVTVMAAIAQAMTDGDMIVVDEAGHAPESVPPTMNTIGDQDSTTYAGGITVHAHDNFRMLVCTNRASKDALNSPFAPSFATRPIVYNVWYPNIDTETQIAKRMVTIDMFGKFDAQTVKKLNEAVPDSVIRYLASLVRMLREGGPKPDSADKEKEREKIAELVPLSARNIANAILALSVLPRDTRVDIALEFTKGDQEPTRRRLIERIFWTDNKRLVNSTDLSHDRVLEFLRFVSQVGKQEFIEAVLSGVAFHVDIAGVSPQAMKKWREMTLSTIM